MSEWDHIDAGVDDIIPDVVMEGMDVMGPQNWTVYHACTVQNVMFFELLGMVRK